MAGPNTTTTHKIPPNQSVPLNVAHPNKHKVSRPFLDWALKHQLHVASAIISLVVSLHILSPPTRVYTRKFLELSYPTWEDHGRVYTQGTDDIHFVFAWIINFTALRAISIEWILRPLASFLGVARKNHLRFAEQGWQVLYYGIFWCLGMHLWYNSVYWLNNAEIWTAWPEREMPGTFKWYNLVQLAFWFQQILVIHIEARRKDHAQMLFHHIITCTLIIITYVYRYTRAANVVLCLMDPVDLLLPIAKILRYLRYDRACKFAFVLFVVTWLISRHILYPKLCWDIYMNVPGPTTMLYGCYSGATNKLLDMPAQPDYFSHLLWPFQDLNGVICLNTEVKYIFLGMLLLLQTLSLIWFGMVLKVVVGTLLGAKLEDTRSDDEGEDVEEFTMEDLNGCVGGGSDLSNETLGSDFGNGLVGTSIMTSQKPRPTTVRQRLMDVENRKELLARIGCEKPIE